MKKSIQIFLALVIVLCAGMQQAYGRDGRDHGSYIRHGGHSGGHVEFGMHLDPGWWGMYPNYSFYPYYFYPYYPSYSLPPVIIQQPPEIYMQPAPQSEAPTYVYYCKDPQGYYPTIPKCPTRWLKVVPPKNPREGEE